MKIKCVFCQSSKAQNARLGEGQKTFNTINMRVFIGKFIVAMLYSEVRKLAEKTMTATQEVGKAITGIQEGTRKNIHNVEQAGVSIEEAAKLSVQSGESLKQILEFVHMVNDQVQSIATASEQQSAASEEINHSVEQVATISAETAQAMEQASSAVADLAQRPRPYSALLK